MNINVKLSMGCVQARLKNIASAKPNVPPLLPLMVLSIYEKFLLWSECICNFFHSINIPQNS